MEMITQKELKEIFYYDGEKLIRRNSRFGIKHSKMAGYLAPNGYIQISVNGKRSFAHRLIYIYHYGSIDDSLEIDHINHIRFDNRISNLRLVTCQQNHFNRKNVKGYSWHKVHKKWQAFIMADGIPNFLGQYSNEEDARRAYLKAKAKYHKMPPKRLKESG